MKKRGFTLIELLAVIVILAIIALIATPIVMNIIENNKKGAVERSAENYLEALEITIASERLDGPVLDGEYEIQEVGSLCILENGEPDCEKSRLEPEVSGDKPSSGIVVIKNGIITTDTIMMIKDYTVTYDSEKRTYVAEIKKDILIEQIILEYPTATYTYEKNGEIETDTMTEYKDYVPKITILPENASNKNLKFEISYNYVSTDIIDENTGVVTHAQPTDTGMTNCGYIKVKATALDESGVSSEIKLNSKLSNPSNCYTSSPWH